MTGRRLTEIVNIGIGGSDLGAVMASRALRHYWQPGMNFHSISNVDGTQLIDLTEKLDPEETLFIICSKTFTTQETMVNATAASEWLSSAMGGDAVANHFAAASTNHSAMDDFGINPDYRFGFWDWVGGRYSIWSAVGLALALVVGADKFWAMLAGARKMDQHFPDSAGRGKHADAAGADRHLVQQFFQARSPRRSCRTTIGSSASRHSCSNCRWSRAARVCARTVRIRCRRTRDR